jgi:hypothetical protein
MFEHCFEETIGKYSLKQKSNTLSLLKFAQQLSLNCKAFNFSLSVSKQILSLLSNN